MHCCAADSVLVYERNGPAAGRALRGMRAPPRADPSINGDRDLPIDIEAPPPAYAPLPPLSADSEGAVSVPHDRPPSSSMSAAAILPFPSGKSARAKSPSATTATAASSAAHSRRKEGEGEGESEGHSEGA